LEKELLEGLSGGINRESLRLMSRRPTRSAESRPIGGKVLIRRDLIERGGVHEGTTEHRESTGGVYPVAPFISAPGRDKHCMEPATRIERATCGLRI
jgi:hypothetical protein